jgi:glutamine cyclotransferase
VTIFGSFELLETVPHDSNAFTQGLELAPSSFPNNNNNQEQQEQQQYYESTGQYGASSVRIVDLQTGEVLHIRNMDSAYFGEGMTHHDGTLVQITWKKGTGFVYNATNLDVMKEFTYQTTNGEGWGICYEPSRDVFFVSDGTNYVHTWDSSSFQLLTKVPVTMRETATTTNEQSVYRINELEWDSVTQTILANIWQTNDIVRIDPQTGFVTHRYNLQSLYRPFSANVLNGIAVTDTANEIWVTGKYWPNMYRIRLMDG